MMRIVRFGAMEAAQLQKDVFVRDRALGLTMRVMGAGQGKDLNAELRKPPNGKPDAKLKVGDQALEDSQFLIIGSVIKGPKDLLGRVLHHIVDSVTQGGKTVIPQLDVDDQV